ARDADPSGSMSLAGGLVGAGAIFLFGTINTIAACSGTDDFCGNANVWPLGAFALLTIATGAVAAFVVARRIRRTERT
ncbi:MAG TPA: hypothetical protein VGQ31_04920, partial [Candidatus Limnocylindrales bacterium]|nr:hypothetical protein [Candidatus Limnocylindrales bacterium]